MAARHQARLAKTDDKGVPARTHLERRAERGDRIGLEAREQLRGPEMPQALEYLWEWFLELNASRSVGMHGLAAITYQDIDAWARLTGREPDPLEVQALMQLDTAWRFPGDEEQA